MANMPVPVDPNLLLQAQMAGVAPGAYAAPIGAGPEGPQVLPYTSTTVTQPSGGSSRMPETPKVQAAEASQEETRRLAEEAQKAKIQAGIQKETFRAEQLDRENALLRQQAEDLAVARREEDAKAAAALTDLRARQAERDRFKPTTYGEEMGWFRKVLSALSVGLGAYGSSMTGGPNHAYQIYAGQEAAHRDKQKALIEKQAKAIEDASGNLAAAQEYRNKRISAVQEDYLERNRRLQKLIEAKIARVPTVATEGKLALAEMRKDYDKIEMDTAQRLAGTKTSEGPKVSTTTVTGEKPGGAGQRPPTEAEIKLRFLGESMKDEIGAIRNGAKLTAADLDLMQSNALRSEAADLASQKGQLASGAIALGRSAGAVPKSKYAGLSPAKQKTANAYDSMVEKYTRMLTGAGMPADEARRMALQSAPVAGDSEAVVEFKLDRMDKAAERMVQLSGPKSGARVAGEAQPPAAARPAPAPPKVRDFARERADLVRANAILKDPKATAQQKRAAQAFKNEYQQGAAR